MLRLSNSSEDKSQKVQEDLITEFDKIIPGLKGVVKPLKAPLSEGQLKFSKEFSSETKTLWKEFDKKRRALERKAQGEIQELSSQMKARIKISLQKRKEILKDQEISKDGKKKQLKNISSTFQARYDKKIKDLVQQIRGDQKKLRSEYMSKDSDFKAIFEANNSREESWHLFKLWALTGILAVSGGFIVAGHVQNILDKKRSQRTY